MQVHEPPQYTWVVDRSRLGHSCTWTQELAWYWLGTHAHESAAEPSSPHLCEAPRSLVVFLTDFYLPTQFLPSSTHPASLKRCSVLYQSWPLGSHLESPCGRVLGTGRICLRKTPLISLESPGHRCEENGGSGGRSPWPAALLSQQPALPPAPGPTVTAPGLPSSTCVGNEWLPGQSQGLLLLLCGFSPAACLH